MLKRLFFFFIAFSLTILCAHAQFKLEVESFEQLWDIEASKNPVLDNNGEPTAILKLQIPILSDVVISTPNQFGHIETSPGEMKIRLTDGTRKISIRHKDFETLDYTFDEPLKGKMVYKLVLKIPDNYLKFGEVSVRITTNVMDANLAINGEQLTTDDGEFLLKLKKGDYPYTLSTSKSGFNPVSGTLVISEEDVKEVGRKDEFIALQTDKKSNLLISGAEGSTIKIDGKAVEKKKGGISLPMGRHYVEVSKSGYTKKFPIDLFKENENLDADIRVPVTIVSPTKAEFTIKPLGNALKPSVTKFKANQPIRLLGKYMITAKAKGYDPLEVEVNATSDMNELKLALPMISEANKLSKGTGKTKQNTLKALQTYRKMIENGDELAMWEYGQLLIERGDNAEGLKYIRQAAESGHPKAAVFTAENIVKGNPTEMRKYLDIALKGGEKSAHKAMGDVYSLYGSTEYLKAYKEYEQYNDSYSRLRRAILAVDHPDVIKIPSSEVIDLLESIEEGDKYYSPALDILGSMAFYGIGMPKSSENAIKYWNKASLGNLSSQAICVLAIANLEKPSLSQYLKYLNLDHIRKDEVIVNGVTVNQFLTRAGQRLDKEQPDLAFKLLDKAYSLGDRSLTTLSYLGKYYKEGKATVKNDAKAKELLKMAIDNYNDVRSMRWLGNIYETEKNLDEAEKVYLKAMNQNDEIAKGYYATLIYNKGKKNYPQAVKLWTEAANAGHKQSVKNLIRYYEKVARDPSKAAYWKKKL